MDFLSGLLYVFVFSFFSLSAYYFNKALNPQFVGMGISPEGCKIIKNYIIFSLIIKIVFFAYGFFVFEWWFPLVAIFLNVIVAPFLIVPITSLLFSRYNLASNGVKSFYIACFWAIIHFLFFAKMDNF